MDSYDVIGLVHSVGEFNGSSYDNYNIHCVRKANPDKQEVGEVTYVFKVKTSLFQERPVSVGDTITPMYDRYGRVVSY